MILHGAHEMPDGVFEWVEHWWHEVHAQPFVSLIVIVTLTGCACALLHFWKGRK